MNNIKVRRNQLISPWGIGSIVSLPGDESWMIAGLDAWDYRNSASHFIINDDRLRKRLEVNELRWPPDYRTRQEDQDNCNLRVPAVRFPRWYYCPYCGVMKKLNYYSADAWCRGESGSLGGRKGPHKKKMLPERFIVVCEHGHIDDFPIAEWLHHEAEHPYNPAECQIFRSTGGTSANLSGVFYVCSCGAKKSLANATTPGILRKRIGYRCTGAKPWLGIEMDKEHPCDCEDVSVLQRGATNVWFGNTQNSIHIPFDKTVDDPEIIVILNQFGAELSKSLVDGKPNRLYIDALAGLHHVDPAKFHDAVMSYIDQQLSPSGKNETILSEDEYRFAEYQVIRESSGSDVQNFHSEAHPIGEYRPALHQWFQGVSLVHKLQETRAFVAFSRLEPGGGDFANAGQQLRLGHENWLPAIMIHGEGIFVEFDAEKLRHWAGQQPVVDRIKKLNDSWHASIYGKYESDALCPEYVLLHTFSHLLINQLSYECGYGSSSIREKIYCSKTNSDFQMHGILLYTASGDSEGSMGGLVRQGKPGYLEDLVIAAIHNAKWCSADPVCIQSSGQGPDSCNLAACHNCALLPETCCENGNRLLDRGIAIGTLDKPEIGYFNDNIEYYGQKL